LAIGWARLQRSIVGGVGAQRRGRAGGL